MGKNNEDKVINIDAISKDDFCRELRNNNIKNSKESKSIKINLDSNSFNNIDTFFDLKIVNSKLDFSSCDIANFNNVKINDSIIENVEEQTTIKNTIIENSTLRSINGIYFENVKFINCIFEDFGQYQFEVLKWNNITYDESTLNNTSEDFKKTIKYYIEKNRATE